MSFFRLSSSTLPASVSGVGINAMTPFKSFISFFLLPLYLHKTNLTALACPDA
jgi:hypothetical protein